MRIKDSLSLKSLQGQRETLMAQLKDASRECAEASARERQLRERLKRIEQKLKALEADAEPKVSEHALLRYLERVKGIELDTIVQEILSPSHLSIIRAAPNCTINVKGIKFIVKNGTVVTTLDAS